LRRVEGEAADRAEVLEIAESASAATGVPPARTVVTEAGDASYAGKPQEEWA